MKPKRTILIILLLVFAFFFETSIILSQTNDGSWTLADTIWPTHQQNNQRTGASSFRGVTTYPIVKWKSEAGINPYLGISAAGFTVGISNTLVVRSASTTILDFDGNILKSDFPGGSCRSTPTISDNGYFFYHSTNRFSAFDEMGNVFWQISFISDCNHSSPAIDENGILYVGLQDGRYAAIDLATSTILWSYPIHPWAASSTPSLGYDGTIYFSASITGEFGKLIALNPDGTLKWENDTYGFTTDPIVGQDGTVYSAATIYDNAPYNTALTAFAEDGTPLWHYYIPEQVCKTTAPAIGSNGTVYFGSLDLQNNLGENHLYAINPDGTLKWKFAINVEAGGYICSTPIVDKENNVFFCSDKFKCYALDPDGRKLWEINVDGDDNHVLRNTPIILDNDFMILPGLSKIVAIIPSTDQVFLPLISVP